MINGCLFMQHAKTATKDKSQKNSWCRLVQKPFRRRIRTSQWANSAGGEADSLIITLFLALMGPVVAILLTLSPSLFFLL